MTVTTIEEALIEKLRLLPPDMQQVALDFIEFLSWKREGKQPRKSSLGLCSDLNISISKEEIDEARREMWERSASRPANPSSSCPGHA